MKNTETINQEAKVEIGDFGPIYRQFQKKPKEAILFLKKQKSGECVGALYRDDIGYVDIVWGVGGKSGYGLCHIIEEHEEEFKQLGFNIEDFIPMVFAFGIYTENQRENKIKLRGENFMLIIKTKWNDKNKRFVMTAFDLRPMSRKNPKRVEQARKKGN
ncbi:MAG: hypothetical protein IKM85_08420 [Bacteroidales bacterium]|nr:hypothetical protein [Bacteroidales bacterium]